MQTGGGEWDIMQERLAEWEAESWLLLPSASRRAKRVEEKRENPVKYIRKANVPRSGI